jgi:hypothetical protein
MASRRLSSQAVLGAIVVLVGLALLLETTEVYDARPLLDYVPSLFVLLGVYALVTSGFNNVVGPLFLILVAGAWQLVTLELVTGETVVQFWPVLIVLFGLSLLLGRRRSRARGVGSDEVSAVAIFGGRELRSTSETFRRADLTALFGGVELDLRGASVAEDDRPARVNAFGAFGGVEVTVPREWNVRMDVLPVFGGAEDERPRREEENPDVDLVVEGFVAFGGVSVKD